MKKILIPAAIIGVYVALHPLYAGLGNYYGPNHLFLSQVFYFLDKPIEFIGVWL